MKRKIPQEMLAGAGVDYPSSIKAELSVVRVDLQLLAS
jgi:hypothetical protein